jgi:hypothetical protein
MPPMIDMQGQKIGRLLVGDFSHTNRFGGCHWNVTCSCGNTLVVNGRDLRRGLLRTELIDNPIWAGGEAEVHLP